MRPLWWMAAVAAGSCLVITLAGGTRVHPEVLFGMLGPLAAVAGTWIAVQRTYRAAPERLPGVLMVGFAAKMVCFAVYVVVMLRLLELRLLPFIVSFTGYFIALYLIEALYLRRLTVTTRSPHR